MLFGISGVELVWCFKKEEVIVDILIIMFIVKVEEDNKIQGLEVGVDDYIIKLFSLRELVVCLKVVL